MGNFNSVNSKHQEVSNSYGSVNELLRSGSRTDEGKRVLADIEVRSNNGRMDVSFTPKSVVSISDYAKDPVRFDPASFAKSLNDKGYAKVKDVAYAGGTAPIVVTQDGSSYLLMVRRDEKAPTNPNTLDALVGRGNSADPLVSLVGEAVEEVMFIDRKGRVVIPQFSQTELKGYNGHVHRTINKLSGRLAADWNVTISNVHAEVFVERMNTPFYLNGVPIGIGFSPVEDGCREASIFDFMLQPYVMKMPIGGLKETIWYETEHEVRGGVPERKSVLWKIKNGSDHSAAVIMFCNGERMGEWGSPHGYLQSAGLDPHMPLAPSTATMVHYLGIDFGFGTNGYMHPLDELIRSSD